jgi:hypothetical protein
MKFKIVLVAVALLGLAACTQDSPAGDDNKHLRYNNDERLVYANPEDFNNVVVFCDGTTRVYVTTEYRPILVTDDRQCGGKGDSQISGGGDK